jgi:hypothetical protein
MQKYYQRLILLTLCIAISYAEVKITGFKDISPDDDGGLSTVYATHVQLVIFLFLSLLNYNTCVFRLWADVTDCVASACVCKVRIEGSSDESQPVQFRKGQENLGSVVFSNLKPNTNYSFVLTCDQSQSSSVSNTLKVTTDYGVPEAPKITGASVASGDVQITWSPPSIPEASFSYYQIYIDKEIAASNVLKNETSHKITKELKTGNHIVNMATCYKTKQGRPICSEKSDAETSFLKEDPTTTTTTSTTSTSAVTITTPTTAKSSGVNSYSFSLSIILSSLYLLLKL